MNFIRVTPRFYLPENPESNANFLAFILPKAELTAEEEISLEDAFTNTELDGSFVFSSIDPNLSNSEEQDAFVDLVYKKIIDKSSSTRGIIWLEDPENIIENGSNSSMMGLVLDGHLVSSPLSASLTPGLVFNVQAAMPLSIESGGTKLIMGASTSPQAFSFTQVSMNQATRGTMDFAGDHNGCIVFPAYIQASSLYDHFNWGFQYFFPNKDDNGKLVMQWLPFASVEGNPGTLLVGFNISINPSDPYNSSSKGGSMSEQYASRQTYFDYLGESIDNRDFVPTQLVSYYRSIFGDTLHLLPNVKVDNDTLPARMVLSEGEETTPAQSFHLGPEGDFYIQNGDEADGKEVNMICGLQGTEFFTVLTADSSGSGDQIRFFSQQNAYSDKFPFEPTSPVAAPPVLDPTVMSGLFKTSWATIINDNTVNALYVAQPKGSALFGTDSIQGANASVYGHTTPGFEFNNPEKSILFPMAPYAGVKTGDGVNDFSKEQVEQFESEILSGLRRNKVGSASGSTTVKNAMFRDSSRTAAVDDFTTSTPSGLVAELSGNQGSYTWDKVILGQNNATGAMQEMYFPTPDAKLLQALQTSDLFLVAANKDNLGDFANSMMIEDWGIKADVGSEQSTTYNDYRNIMIIKGRRGALYIPEKDKIPTSGIVLNSDQWTNADTFASPSGADQNTNELIILSQWIQSYFKSASEQDGNPYFKKFNTIAKDPNWTGILFLRTDIDKLPNNLTGIMAGVRYPENFNAHHFAIDISPVSTGATGPTLGVNPSSMFGLIYYEDEFFKNTIPVQPVRPFNANKYDFCLLTLKVLFENTAVESFESYAQLTLNELYSSRVTGMGPDRNALNTIVLKGSLQITNDEAIYAMGSDSDNAFYLDNNILNKVEVTNVQLTTIDDGVTSGEVSTLFGMSGYLDYNVIADPKEGLLDVFSFGNLPEEDKKRQGLYFSNLGINMSFSKEALAEAELANRQVASTYVFDTTKITFDINKSTPRSTSLYLSLALDMESLVIGNAEEGPNKLGYLQVLSDIRLGSVNGDIWYGLKFKVNMGTPGELAGKVNLTSYILTAWSPTSTGEGSYTAQLGIMLPGTGGGAKLISLQSVMTLSIGQIKLVYTDKAFLLMLTEIALKFFGLLKVPPSGSTLFYLFGNPQNNGKPSGLGWYAQYSNKPKSDSDSTDLKKISTSNSNYK